MVDVELSTIDGDLQATRRLAGETVTLLARVRGDDRRPLPPNGSIDWFRNGELVQQGRWDYEFDVSPETVGVYHVVVEGVPVEGVSVDPVEGVVEAVASQTLESNRLFVRGAATPASVVATPTSVVTAPLVAALLLALLLLAVFGWVGRGFWDNWTHGDDQAARPAGTAAPSPLTITAPTTVAAPTEAPSAAPGAPGPGLPPWARTAPPPFVLDTPFT